MESGQRRCILLASQNHVDIPLQHQERFVSIYMCGSKAPPQNHHMTPTGESARGDLAMQNSSGAAL